MISSTLVAFRNLRPPVRALVYLFWIYGLVGSMVSIFLQVFLYEKFASVALNAIATIIYNTGIMLGFCILGVLAAQLRLNIKHGFVVSFLLMTASIASILLVTSTATAYAAMLFWGFGQGVFWLTVNTFELSETHTSERDFFASVLNAGTQVLQLVGPAFAALLLWLSGTLHLGTYTLLFIVAPALFMLGFFCFESIRDYQPSPIRTLDLWHFFQDRRNQAAQLYTIGTGFRQFFSVVVPPLVILAILGTAFKVGIYNAAFALFSAVCVLIVAQYRTPSNRLVVFGITSAGVALVTVLLGWQFTFAALVFYTIIEGFLSPLANVSSDVVDLDSMEIGRSDSDFYATMILRDFALWVWRTVAGLVFLWTIYSFGVGRIALSNGLYLLALGLLVTYAGAALLYRTQRYVQ